MDILKTNKSNCKDCHKCIKYCPVNAIKFSEGQAQVDIDRCILDGECYNICPQKAKSVRSDLDKVKNIIQSGKLVIASVAPSIFAYYSMPESGKILAFLKSMGFNRFEQTARASFGVSLAHLKSLRAIPENLISSSCPSVVNLIEAYYPDLISNIAPVVSPMVAHHKLLQSEIKEPFEMVFIGPCIAKKREAEHAGISACLTFQEVENWIKDEKINIDKFEPIFFDDFYSGNLSLFPLDGELAKLAGIHQDSMANEVISITGVKNIQVLLDSIRNNKVKYKFIEAMACDGGCISGPVRPEFSKEMNHFELKSNLIREVSYFDNSAEMEPLLNIDLSRSFENKYKPVRVPEEDEIRKVLRSIGKEKREDELNCGSCGYDSCRDKAIAVINGMAESEMCIPYMKTKAENLSAIILEANPNGVLILDQNLQIKDVNPAFTKLARMERDDVLGKNVSCIFDDTRPFENVLKNKKMHESTLVFKDRKIKKFIFSVPDQKIIMTFLIDITDVEIHKETLEKVKRETLDNAKGVMERQMKVAHDVAVLLAETTAETEILLGKLINIIRQE